VLPRRSFLKLGVAALLGQPLLRAAADLGASASAPADPLVAFAVVGDTHYLADRDDPTRLQSASRAINTALIDQLNALAGREIDPAAGGGRVRELAAVLHVGDLIDSGDKNGAVIARMQATEWAEWQKDYGLTGTDGRLKVPVREIHGNHDGPQGKGLVPDGIIARNRRRPGVTGLSANGLHYSWDAGPVHFVHLGIVVGRDPAVTRRRRYDPMGSLEFLVADLARHVGASGRPVVVAHHVDFARYCGEVPDETAVKNEWDYADVAAFHAALKPYRVAAIVYGHTHVRNVFAWSGPRPEIVRLGRPLPAGIPTFNTDNSGHFSGPAQAFLYVEVHAEEVVVRELATADGWQTSRWTPLSWRLPHGRG
jgi:predicted phosphodiesterase